MQDHVAQILATQINQHAEVMIILAAMEAANKDRESQGEALAYGEKDFLDIQIELGIHHNARVTDILQI